MFLSLGDEVGPPLESFTEDTGQGRVYPTAQSSTASALAHLAKPARAALVPAHSIRRGPARSPSNCWSASYQTSAQFQKPLGTCLYTETKLEVRLYHVIHVARQQSLLNVKLTYINASVNVSTLVVSRDMVGTVFISTARAVATTSIPRLGAVSCASACRRVD